MAMLTVQDLTLGYEGRTLVSHLNFSLEEGDYLCIVGENGSGKSTLMRTILGLQPPVSGQVLFRKGLKSSHVGYLPQQTPIQRDFPASVEEIVRSGFQGRCGLRPFYDREEKAMARENMERMGVLDLRDRCYRELSGGQQQRVLLARAIARQPELLILDEPCSALDPEITAEMYGLFDQLKRELALTMLISTHDWAYVRRAADRVLELGRQIEFIGTAREWMDTRGGAPRD